MSNRIKMLRQQRHMKQSELAKELGISQNTLSTWETGRYEPDNEMLKKIARIFNVSVDYLIGENPPWENLAGDQIDMLRMMRLMRTVEQLSIVQFDQVLDFSSRLMANETNEVLTGSLTQEEERLLLAWRRCDDRARQMVALALEPWSEKKEDPAAS